MNDMNFEQTFEAITGFSPFKWQTRLYNEWFSQGEIPAALDLPTGLGKTSVMTIWYLALITGAELPRRLVYVVDRRAVVDQATRIAEQIKQRSEDSRLRISTLRGQYIDNRDWLKHPADPAIIVGTVDMIGSKLLFSGYGVSRRMRPYQAGFIGVDTLIALDESHLVPPFEKLLEAIVNDTAKCRPMPEHQEITPPLRLLSLSATGHKREGECFYLHDSDCDDPVVAERLGANKNGRLVDESSSKAADKKLANEAWTLSENGQKSCRIIVYCNSRDTAEKVKTEIDKGIKTELFVGARRIKERSDAEERLKKLGFIGNSPDTLDGPVFLVATSAGEVGVDLDADHMVCDLVEWERMIQRFGRVNRKGGEDRQADIRIVAFEKNKEKLNKLKKPFEHLSKNGNMDLSPGALLKLKRQAENNTDIEKIIQDATSPHPLYPVLTHALIDAWSMTSLREHRGRPEIQPWLRGWKDKEQQQTTVIWRKYLPVREGAKVTKGERQQFFEAAPPHLSEKLETETWRVKDWLTKRANSLLESRTTELKPKQIIAFALEADGALRESFQLDYLANKDNEEDIKKVITGATLILDDRFGGLGEDGLLDYNAEHEDIAADNDDDWRIGFRIQSSASQDNNGAPFIHSFATRQPGEDGEGGEYLFISKDIDDITEESRATSKKPQLLEEHQEWTEKYAHDIADEVGLTGDLAEALTIAARLHDEGKRAQRWQHAFNAEADGIYAKTKGPVNQSVLGGYRHEFGSLHYAEKDPMLKQLPSDLQDLVLHLIAAHHGHARPVIETRGCDDAPPSLLQRRARDVALRFVHLQRRWGPWGLAWWEALLRAADQQASRKNDHSGTANG